jgi:hypothetical protein
MSCAVRDAASERCVADAGQPVIQRATAVAASSEPSPPTPHPSVMSYFWADQCEKARTRPVPDRIFENYASCGVTVKQISLLVLILAVAHSRAF